MITISDNTATNLLIRRFGMDAFNEEFFLFIRPTVIPLIVKLGTIGFKYIRIEVRPIEPYSANNVNVSMFTPYTVSPLNGANPM